jgi:hypothetical protein
MQMQEASDGNKTWIIDYTKVLDIDAVPLRHEIAALTSIVAFSSAHPRPSRRKIQGGVITEGNGQC